MIAYKTGNAKAYPATRITGGSQPSGAFDANDASNFQFINASGPTGQQAYSVKSCLISTDNVATAIYVRVNGFLPSGAPGYVEPTGTSTGEASAAVYDLVLDDALSQTVDVAALLGVLVNTVSVWVPSGSNADTSKVQVRGVPAP